jgi:hypothetical protein
MLGRELIMRNLATTVANYATGNSVTLAGATQWTDGAGLPTGNPIGIIRGAKSAIHAKLFMVPNLAIVPYQVMTVFEDHTSFLTRIQYSGRSIFSTELLAALFGIQRWLVPGVGYNTANNYGAAETLSYLWGDDVILAWVPDRPGLKKPAYGYEFRWGSQFVDRWREEKRVSDLIRVRRRYDVKMTALDGTGKQVAGYLIKNTLNP